MADKTPGDMPWGGIAALVIFVSGIYVAGSKGIEHLRPPEKEQAQSQQSTLEVDARLWEDPFVAFKRYRERKDAELKADKERGNQPEECPPWQKFRKVLERDDTSCGDLAAASIAALSAANSVKLAALAASSAAGRASAAADSLARAVANVASSATRVAKADTAIVKSKDGTAGPGDVHDRTTSLAENAVALNGSAVAFVKDGGRAVAPPLGAPSVRQRSVSLACPLFSLRYALKCLSAPWPSPIFSRRQPAL